MKSKNLIAAIVFLVIGIISGAIIVTEFDLIKNSNADNIGTENSPVTLNSDVQAFNNMFTEVAEKVTPSIVQILVVVERKNQFKDMIPEGFEFFFPFDENIPKEQQGGGSGIIIKIDGYILTNNHVIDGATQIEVTLWDRRTYQAELIGADPLTDLAVIKIDETNLPAAYFGNSDELKVGQWVMAIGNPLALRSTVTAGIVSALGRNEINLIKDTYGVEDYIQTDAAINPGNSGGALVDLNGAVIGINTAIATNGYSQSYIGYGFAIPINLAKSVAEDIIEDGQISRGYIGVRISEVDDATAKAVGLDKPQGVMVQEVMKDGAASEEDIKAGDIILKINGKEMNRASELQSFVARHRAGDKLDLTIYRDGNYINRTIVLKSREEDKNITAVETVKDIKKSQTEINTITIESIGLTVKNLTETELEKIDLQYGIAITDVKLYSKAYKQNLVKGYIIMEINGEQISDVEEFKNVIDNNKGKAVLLRLRDTAGNIALIGLEIPN
ncbi:MAG: Do family serine endopeptidase [Ignavibacteriales bacterium]|nr:Do family serine endopeptidase [Ignavibacteriales bacterium]